MAKGILAGVPLSRNHILKIVHILEQSFDHYLDPNSPYFSDYLQNLRTLTGLGLTAALADQNLLYLYQPYFVKILVLEEEHFKMDYRINKSIAQSTTEMIRIASICFYTLKFPGYYKEFIAALGNILKIPGLSEQKDAEEILDCLKVY